MTGTNITFDLRSPCDVGKASCLNCHSHFMAVRPYLKSIVVSKHFVKDLRDEEEAKSIVRDVLDCSNTDFTELHKFEENVDGNLIFRAKREGLHVVYCVTKSMGIIFLRAFSNYSEYARFLEDKREIRKTIEHT